MTREKYIPYDNQWISSDEFDRQAFAENVYQEVGERFPLTVNKYGTVLLQLDDIPDGVSENDVKNAIKDHHPHR